MDFCGKPLLAWSIEAAKGASAPISRIVVSSEDGEILRVARGCGAHCPFTRPADMATDTASGLDPVLHALDWLADNEDYHPEWLLLLQPTSPLRTAVDIDAAYQLALDHDAESVMGVTEAQSHPMWTKTIEGDGKLRDFIARKGPLGIRQDLPPAFVINGAIYLIRVSALVRNHSFSSDETFAYRMPRERSWDIDDELDFKIAAFLKNDALDKV